MNFSAYGNGDADGVQAQPQPQSAITVDSTQGPDAVVVGQVPDWEGRAAAEASGSSTSGDAAAMAPEDDIGEAATPTTPSAHSTSTQRASSTTQRADTVANSEQSPLVAWWNAHLSWPYPTPEEKQMLADSVN